MICVLLMSLITFAATAKAVPVNPTEWNFSLTTYGSRSYWSSTTDLVPTYPQYDYDWQLTKLEVLVFGQVWHDVLPIVPINERSGSGSLGQLPWEDEIIIQINNLNITATFMASGDIHGHGGICVDNVDFGLGISGARFQGNVTVTGVVPEPATIALLGTAGVWVLTRKRRRTTGNSANESRSRF